MMTIWNVLILILIVMVVTAVICAGFVLAGGFLMFKGKSAQPFEKFLGGVPKGQAFNVTDGLDNEEFPKGSGKEEQSALKKNENFMKLFGGKE